MWAHFCNPKYDLYNSFRTHEINKSGGSRAHNDTKIKCNDDVYQASILNAILSRSACVTSFPNVAHFVEHAQNLIEKKKNCKSSVPSHCLVSIILHTLVTSSRGDCNVHYPIKVHTVFLRNAYTSINNLYRMRHPCIHVTMRISAGYLSGISKKVISLLSIKL